MSENEKYTIVVKSNRVEVSEAVYRAYHKEREAERYQKKLIHQFELSLERFQDDGVNVECICQSKIPPNYNRKFLQRSKKIIALVTSV